jgi:L-seryl-tRNA(Ser) seleniumtransferase
MGTDQRRGLPRVDNVVGHPSLADACKQLGQRSVTRLVREAIDAARQSLRDGTSLPSADDIAQRVLVHASRILQSRARRVINATGVVLHTNLGRAPLGPRAIDALARSAAGYTSIEIDLETGKRGRRGAFAEDVLCELTGAEAALVVNNNAAAVLLMLGTLAAGRSVVVSRGELVEIGGGFRVPDVMARSGARLVEVGTTNKTRISDYARALETTSDAVAILRVHQGNFRQVGFVERPEHDELARFARDKHILLLEDLGGGALVDLDPLGLSHEPTVKDSISKGSDIVCFSTDKVLGGPQGGVLLGKRDLVERCRRDPLARALRLGRLPLVALEATLACYLEGDLDGIPALAAVRAPTNVIHARADRLCGELERRGVAAFVIELLAAVGGGACAEDPLPSWGIAVKAKSPEQIAQRLRVGTPAVLSRVQDDLVLFDVRTLLDGEDELLVNAIDGAMKGRGDA